jgi:YD repeat-containing protein
MKKIFFLLALTSIFAACKKDHKPPPVLNTKGLLVGTMTTIISPDTTISTYTYDDNNRIVKIVSTTTGIAGQDIISYIYDAAGDVIIRNRSGGNRTEIDIVYYANSVPSALRTIEKIGNDTVSNAINNTFTVSNGRVVRENVAGGADGLADTITYVGNDVNKFYQLDETGAPVNFVFGTKNSPFKNSRFKWVIDFEDIDELFMEFDENDPIGTAAPSVESFHNTYNAQGYPTQIIYGPGFFDINKGAVQNFTYINAK